MKTSNCSASITNEKLKQDVYSQDADELRIMYVVVSTKMEDLFQL